VHGDAPADVVDGVDGLDDLEAEIVPTRLQARWWFAAAGFLVVSCVLGLTVGTVSIAPHRVLLELLDHVPGLRVHSGLGEFDAAIVWQVRAPRVAMAVLVGAMLALAGGAYQGAFRNPLADPYSLGAASGAGLGITLVIAAGARASGSGWLPLAGFSGALLAVALTYAVGATWGGARGASSLILAGIAVANFLTALQTYVQQRNVATIREVYSWILGRLGGATWHDVALLTPYVIVTSVVLLALRRSLDVLTVGDAEATTLGLDPSRLRLVVVVAASLGTAAAVAASGLIAFVGIIVPHTIRLLTRHSYRVVLPLSLLGGAGFLVIADLLSRTLLSPAEIPIGVVTAFFGAPFFLIVLRTSRIRE
jgi:iron complex transport system permease protein